MIHGKTNFVKRFFALVLLQFCLCPLGHSPIAHCFSALILFTRLATKGTGCENMEMKANLITVSALYLCAVLAAAYWHAKEEECALLPSHDLDAVNR